MDRNEQIFFKELLANLRIEVKEAGYMRVPPTWRDIDYTPHFNKLYLIEAGEGMVEVSDRTYYPKPNELYLLPQGVRQSYSFVHPDNTFLKYWVHFTATIGDINLFDFIQTPDFITASPQLFEVFARLVKSYQNHSDFTANMIVKSCMYEIVSLFLESIGSDKIKLVGNKDMSRLNAVLCYIDNHLEQNITVAQLAKEAYLHPNYFIRLFKNKMGMSPIHYINQKRLQKAKELLALPDLTVQEVAIKTGFQNVSYFFNMFKKQTGITPSEYRLSHFS